MTICHVNLPNRIVCAFVLHSAILTHFLGNLIVLKFRKWQLIPTIKASGVVVIAELNEAT
jgi:hypothetical protein